MEQAEILLDVKNLVKYFPVNQGDRIPETRC